MPDPHEDVRMELARQVSAKMDEMIKMQTEYGAKMSTIGNLIGEDHDTLSQMKPTMEDLKSNSAKTATGVIRLAEIAEARAKRDAEDRKRQAELEDRRWGWLTENWKLVAIIVIAIFAPGFMPQILGAMGLQQAPQVVYQPAPEPAPVAAPEE